MIPPRFPDSQQMHALAMGMQSAAEGSQDLAYGMRHPALPVTATTQEEAHVHGKARRLAKTRKPPQNLLFIQFTAVLGTHSGYCTIHINPKAWKTICDDMAKQHHN